MTLPPALDSSAEPPPSEANSKTVVDEDQYLTNKRKIKLEILQVKLQEKKYRLGLKMMKMELEKENMKVKKTKMEVELLQIEQERNSLLLLKEQL